MISILPEDPKNSALPQRHALWSHHPSSLKAHRTSVFGRHSMHPALKGVRSPGQFTKQLTSSGKNCKVGKPINSYSYNSITVMGWWYYDYCSPMVDDTMTKDDYSYNSIIIGQTCGPQLSSKSHDIHRHQDFPTSKIYCEDSIHQLIQEETIINKYNIWLVVSTPLRNMKVSWDYSSEYMEKKCSKPPASIWNEWTIWCNCYCHQYHTSNNYNDTKYKRSGDFSRSVSFLWMFNELNCHGYCWNLMIHDAKKKNLLQHQTWPNMCSSCHGES